jgi:hypothetical protein
MQLPSKNRLKPRRATTPRAIPDLVIQARRDMLRFATAGDPPLLRIAPADNSGGHFTLEELLTSYRKNSEAQNAETKRS